jgi:hypothetical protein
MRFFGALDEIQSFLDKATIVEGSMRGAVKSPFF